MVSWQPSLATKGWERRSLAWSSELEQESLKVSLDLDSQISGARWREQSIDMSTTAMNNRDIYMSSRHF